MSEPENTAADRAHYPPLSPVAVGLRCACPRCGQGRLYDGMLTPAKRCMACGLDYAFIDSGDGPAVFVILILGALVVTMALIVEVKIEPPLWVHALIWPFVILAGTLAMLRPLKATLIALQFKHRDL